MSSKKKEQLGMNPSTASGRLVKDILWKLIVDTGQNKCYQCGEEMMRENFSIEHKTPWLDSEDPVGLYFDLDNISFSHLKCNTAQSRSRASSPSPGQRKSISQKLRVESPEGMNWCNICKRHLPIENFGKHKRRYNGLRNECKGCRKK